MEDAAELDKCLLKQAGRRWMWIEGKVEAPSPTAWFQTREVDEGEAASSHTSFKAVRLISWITGLASERKEERWGGGWASISCHPSSMLLLAALSHRDTRDSGDM